MEFNTKAFFTENKEQDVQGFVIIESSETGPGYDEPSHRIAEKSQEFGWLTYWMPEETLLARIERGECSYGKDVSTSQFNGVLNLAGVSQEIL